MNKETAVKLAKKGFVLKHEPSNVMMYVGESGAIINESFNEEGDWQVLNKTKLIYFISSNRDTDASKCKISEDKDGNIKLRWYDCLDNVTNTVHSTFKGLEKLNQMQKSLDYARELVLEKIKENSHIEPINFKEWQDGMAASNCFMFNAWYHECQNHQNYLNGHGEV